MYFDFFDETLIELTACIGNDFDRDQLIGDSVLSAIWASSQELWVR